jgi:serine protease Do
LGAPVKEHGQVTRGWLGVQIQPVTAGIAEGLGMKKAQGALVDEVKSDSPAAKAGLESGDVITAVNGSSVKDARELTCTISAAAPKSTVKLDILRNGQAKSLEVALGQMPGEHQAKAEITGPTEGEGFHLGVMLAPADRDDPDAQGVTITAVDPDGAAAQQGLEPGDVILKVNGAEVSSPSQVREALADAKSQGKHEVMMKVKVEKEHHLCRDPASPRLAPKVSAEAAGSDTACRPLRIRRMSASPCGSHPKMRLCKPKAPLSLHC